MLKEFIKKKRLKDFFDTHNKEVVLSLILTFILVLILFKIDLFNNFNTFRVALQNISIYIAAGLLAMIGIILTGLALILSVLDRKFINEINQVNKNTVTELMLCFKFLIFNLGFSNILFFSIHFMLFSTFYINNILFYIFLFLIIYYFIFLVFYTIELISNSIDLYLIKNINEDINTDESAIKKNNIITYVDKVKIEYLMRNANAGSYENFFNSIDKIIDDIANIDEITSGRLKKIFRNLYDPNNNKSQ